MAWLVTGGAGYIGSHIVRRFLQSQMSVVVLDDLSTGFRSFLPEQTPFVHGSLVDRAVVRDTFASFPIDGVVHTAGYKYAGESVTLPLHTYEHNVRGTMVLLSEMQRANVSRLVFSSSAAVYGTPHCEMVTESTRTHPESPYGQTKLIGEWMIANQARANGLHHTSLRYFNVVGSDNNRVYDSSPYNLVPAAFLKLLRGGVPLIYGDDYDTPDGTCVRDYVHVSDIAATHVVAAQKLTDNELLRPVYNLGSGTGSSVREVMSAIRAVTGMNFVPKVAERREGDPARLVASGSLAAMDLEWSPTRDLNEMVDSAWKAVRVRPSDPERKEHTCEQWCIAAHTRSA